MTRSSDLQPVLSDEELVAASLDGNQAAFGLLVRRYQRRLTAFLGQLVGDMELARAVPEAFIRLTAFDRFDPQRPASRPAVPGSPTIRHRPASLPRLHTVPLVRQDAEGEEVEIAVVDVSKDPLGHFENRELASAIKVAIRGLRSEYRELVLLRHFAGLSYQDIADLKGMPLGTVKNKLFRAHSVLRRALQEYL
jgi:RNA polymerase sigma-70 factor (ECF subfamily)